MPTATVSSRGLLEEVLEQPVHQVDLESPVEMDLPALKIHTPDAVKPKSSIGELRAFALKADKMGEEVYKPKPAVKNPKPRTSTHHRLMEFFD